MRKKEGKERKKIGRTRVYSRLLPCMRTEPVCGMQRQNRDKREMAYCTQKYGIKRAITNENELLRDYNLGDENMQKFFSRLLRK